MPDLTPDVTTTPNFDPGRVAIASGWLVYDVGYHTCGGYGPESGYAHEPGCGAEPMCEVVDIPALLAAAAERDALAAAVERVRALHRPVGIYDECECSDEAKAEGHEDVEEVGLTCNRMYTVCAECCRDDVYQTEDCANYHDHKPDEAHHCPTIRALDATPDTGGES